MKKTIFTIILTLFLVIPLIAIAAPPQTAQQLAGAGLDETASSADLQAGDLPTTIGTMVGVLLSILGIVFLVIVLYGGITWMTAGGEEASVKKGRHMIVEGAVGLVICLSAYSLSIYVVSKLTSAGL